MADFAALPMNADEARALAAAELRVDVPGADWCLAQLQDTRDLAWPWLVRQLRLAHAVHPDVVARLHQLAAPPKKLLGIRMPGARRQDMLRLRANLALLWLAEDAGLDGVVQAIEGNDADLRSAALRAISACNWDLRWPDRYYEALFDSCQRIFDDTSGDDRMYVVGAMFEKPVPALAEAMRGYLANAPDFRQRLAAVWLLRQGHEDEVRGYFDAIAAAAFPALAEQRTAWYREVDELLREMKQHAARAPSQASLSWTSTTVLALIDALVSAAQVDGEPGIDERWYIVADSLHAVSAQLTPAAMPLLARWAKAHRPGGGRRDHALARYASYAGEAAFDDAVDTWLEDLPGADLERQGGMARLLMAFAPASRYAALAPVLRTLFDAVPPQEKDSYGHTRAQEALSGLAAALATFDPGAAEHIEARLDELGSVQVREVRWALAGRTVVRIAALLTVGGAIGPMSRRSLQLYTIDGGLVRQLLDAQDRLATLNSRDDDIDPPTVKTLKKLARIVFPAVELEAVTRVPGARARFIHGDRVFETSAAGEDLYLGTAAGFNRFLEHIGHPQRVFQIGEDGGASDNDIAAFCCGDPVRLPAVAAQLGFPITLAA
jgi:hypothetical protein